MGGCEKNRIVGMAKVHVIRRRANERCSFVYKCYCLKISIDVNVLLKEK